MKSIYKYAGILIHHYDRNVEINSPDKYLVLSPINYATTCKIPCEAHLHNICIATKFVAVPSIYLQCVQYHQRCTHAF